MSSKKCKRKYQHLSSFQEAPITDDDGAEIKSSSKVFNEIIHFSDFSQIFIRKNNLYELKNELYEFKHFLILKNEGNAFVFIKCYIIRAI